MYTFGKVIIPNLSLCFVKNIIIIKFLNDDDLNTGVKWRNKRKDARPIKVIKSLVVKIHIY